MQDRQMSREQDLEELNLRNSQALRRFTVGGISLHGETHG